jgi:hypothetical protein
LRIAVLQRFKKYAGARSSGIQAAQVEFLGYIEEVSGENG